MDDERLERRDGGQSVPLLVGLLDSAAARRSLDSSIPLSSSLNGHAVTADDALNLDEIAAKRTAGGGMANSIANMANSILGAGKLIQSNTSSILTIP
jgi:sodium-coupled neutral amino acid transporter 11